MKLVLQGLCKRYEDTEVLRPLDLEIRDGEFLSILGPSGSGKTTIFRLIGGFAQPSGGRILLNGKDLTRVPTNRRPINTVFQDYALFPHMTAAKNVAYGLMIRGMPKAEIAKIVSEALEVVGLGKLAERYPSALSGGQRQRVALARAIVCQPEIILLDEPLSALDAELRRQMQGFLKDLQRRIGTTFVFVTHDQQEAISISDRMVVMNVGMVEQVGTPKDIYYRPQTRFVAGFFGDNNICDAEIDAGGRLVTPLGTMARPDGVPAGPRKVAVAIRPELFTTAPRDDALAIETTATAVEFAGAVNHLSVLADGTEQPLTVKMSSDPGARVPTIGEKLTLWLRNADVAVVEHTT